MIHYLAPFFPHWKHVPKKKRCIYSGHVQQCECFFDLHISLCRPGHSGQLPWGYCPFRDISNLLQVFLIRSIEGGVVFSNVVYCTPFRSQVILKIKKKHICTHIHAYEPLRVIVGGSQSHRIRENQHKHGENMANNTAKSLRIRML